MATYESLEEIRRTNLGMTEALDRVRRGVFGLSWEGRVGFANETARTNLAQNDALRIDNGILTAARADQTRMIHRMIGSVARGDAPSVLTIERSDGRSSLPLEPVRLGGVIRLIDSRPPMLLLLVNDPEIETNAVVALIRERYRLTATKSVVTFHAPRARAWRQ